MSELITVGLDLAKNVFQAHGADPQPVIDSDLFSRKRGFHAFSQPKTPNSQETYFS